MEVSAQRIPLSDSIGHVGPWGWFSRCSSRCFIATPRCASVGGPQAVGSRLSAVASNHHPVAAGLFARRCWHQFISAVAPERTDAVSHSCTLILVYQSALLRPFKLLDSSQAKVNCLRPHQCLTTNKLRLYASPQELCGARFFLLFLSHTDAGGGTHSFTPQFRHTSSMQDRDRLCLPCIGKVS